MIGARVFNEQNEQAVEVIYGAVTTGSNWKFLRLTGSQAHVDRPEYHISQVSHVIGILKAMLLGTAG
jgi:hypothetical protein